MKLRDLLEGNTAEFTPKSYTKRHLNKHCNGAYKLWKYKS